MCGIAGITGHEPERVGRMTRALQHRGPDDEGLFTDTHVSLGHRRLAVIDLTERGAQPMHFGPYVIVFNGEIYNFREIRRELEHRGDRFRSDTDTEVILHAYAAWGAECVTRFNGMFAFAIYDQVEHELFLARDRLGIKPLFYARHGDTWLFASEIKALLCALPERRMDAGALADYLRYRFVPDERTLFEGVMRLAPGHTMTLRLRDGRQTIARYWRLAYGNNGGTLAENAERVRAVLRESVARRLIADVPLGAYLSGGLDSSAIVALMREVAERPVHTFTVNFGDGPSSEAPYAAQVAREFGTVHTEIDVTADAVEVLPRVARHLGEPIADAATIPVYLMAEATKPHATVVLSGEGSDELFAGYAKYRWLYASRMLPNLPHAVRGGIAGRLSALMTKDLGDRYARFAAVFDAPALRRLVAFDADAVTHFDPAPLLATGDTLHDLLNLDVHTWLPNDLLMKGDTMTMAHGVEARFPFLDHELVEFAATIPAAQKLRWQRDKLVYREAVRPLLPQAIAARRKQGFTVPLRQWLESGLRDYAMELGSRVEIPLLNRAEVRRIVAHRPRTVFGRRQFWTILFLLVWYREVFRK